MLQSEAYLAGYRAACARIVVEMEPLETVHEVYQLVNRIADGAAKMQVIAKRPEVPMQAPGQVGS